MKFIGLRNKVGELVELKNIKKKGTVAIVYVGSKETIPYDVVELYKKNGIEYELYHIEDKWYIQNRDIVQLIRELNWDNDIIGIDLALPENSKSLDLDVLPLFVLGSKLIHRK